MNLSRAAFAFLAACHTAEQSESGLRDVILHLAGAMQFTGYRSIIGTTWAMEDADGPDVARRFYEEMLRNVYVPNVVRAIWNATRKMREKNTMLGSLVTHAANWWYGSTVAALDDVVEQRHKRAARALWTVTREMKGETTFLCRLWPFTRRMRRTPLERWVNFVHIGA